MEISFGDQEAQKAFAERYHSFITGFVDIKKAFDTVISKTKRENPEDKVIYYLARMTIEDFNEIVVLCANGLSTGGMKILRGMFERTVVLMYLHKHPDEIKLFLEYFWIGHYKLGQAIENAYPGFLSEDTLKEAKENRDRVKSLFEIPDCRACNTKRTNFTWTRKDLVSMAKEVGMDKSMVAGYYLPMEETHTTVGSIFRRMGLINTKERIDYDDGPKPNEDRKTLIITNQLLLLVLDTLKKHFNLEMMEEVFDKCQKNYFDFWQSKKANESNPESTNNSSCPSEDKTE